MKTLLILLAVVVVVGVGLGFYLGWFNLSSSNDAGKPDVTVSVDKDKIESDKGTVVDTVQDLGHKAADKIETTSQKAPD
jgi:hypothetical protein